MISSLLFVCGTQLRRCVYSIHDNLFYFVDVRAIDLAFDIKVSLFYECDRVMLKCQNVPELSLMVFNYMF